MADKIVELGLDKLGYNYVNLDDCWQSEGRDSQGHVIVDSRFPSGIRSLADYIHSKGLLFGIYSSAGTKTCQGRAGSLNFEEVDAQDYAAWQVDYLKYDNCYNQSIPGKERYAAMGEALRKVNRTILYSICNWGLENTTQWAPGLGNSWRTTDDISANFASVRANFFINQEQRAFAGPGGWNDPDMLEVGVKSGDQWGLTIDEEQTHFALWAIAKAPLIIGADLRSIRRESLDILKNEDLIAVSQDPESWQATCFGPSGCDGDVQAYYTAMSDGSRVVVVTNWGSSSTPSTDIAFEFTIKDIGLKLK